MRFQSFLSIWLCLGLLDNTIALPMESKEPKYLDLAFREPHQPIWPSKAFRDAPYSFSEGKLRGAIKMSSAFSFGKKKSVILVPGTGYSAETSFTGIIKLMKDNPLLETVVLDIPDTSLGDCQENSEFVAYAINYVSGISNNANVSVIAWSQGTINTQWALKYWPSNRKVVSDFVALSSDIKGSIVADLLDKYVPLAPALIQQDSNSMFISTLRSNGGDSAYVPTTSIFSSFDEAVIPQTADSRASGYFKDARNVGVSNILVQKSCFFRPAGLDVSHAGILSNSLAISLAMDALSNPGPGDINWIDLPSVCSRKFAYGLTEEDAKLPNPTIQQIWNMFKNSNPLKIEPPIKAYAL